MRNPYATDENAMHRVTKSDLEAMRPGCTDFLSLPSLRNGSRIDYQAPKIDMTNRLKDQQSHSRD